MDWDRQWPVIRRATEWLRPRRVEEAKRVLESVLRGRETSEIGHSLHMSERTVEDYFRAINDIYGTKHVRQAAVVQVLSELVEAATHLLDARRGREASVILERVLDRLEGDDTPEVKRIQADALRGLADFRRGMFHFLGPSAIVLYDRSLKLYSALSSHWLTVKRIGQTFARGFRRDFATAAWMRGLCIRWTSGPEEEIEVLNVASQVLTSSKTGTDYMLGNLRRDQARSYSLANAWRPARQLFEESAKRLENTDDSTGLGTTYVWMASVYRHSKEYDHAYKLIERGFRTIPRSAVRHLSSAYLERAELLSAVGEFDAAVRDANEVQLLATTYGIQDRLEEAKKIIGGVERRRTKKLRAEDATPPSLLLPRPRQS